MKTLIVFQRLSCWGGDHDDHGDEDQHHAQDENADDHHVPMFAVELRPC